VRSVPENATRKENKGPSIPLIPKSKPLQKPHGFIPAYMVGTALLSPNLDQIKCVESEYFKMETKAFVRKPEEGDFPMVRLSRHFWDGLFLEQPMGSVAGEEICGAV